MLAALLALFALGGGGLYANGYWDSWEDRTPEIAAVIEAEVRDNAAAQGQTVPDAVVKAFSTCAATVITSTAENLECPLNAEGESAIEVAVVCIKKNPLASAMAGNDIAECVFEAQATQQ